MTSVLAYPCRVLENPGRDRKRKNGDTIFGGIAIEIKIGNHHQLRRREQQYGDWSHIDADILEYILKMLPLADILGCRGVCTWWRSVSRTYLSISINSLPKTYPPLIIWDNDFSGDQNVSWSFFDVLKTDGGGNLYYLSNTKSQELLGKMGPVVGYSSSSNGGCFLFKDLDCGHTLYLFYPLLFSGSILHLPVSGDPSQTYGIVKAVLWGDPISNCSYGLVMLHYGYKPPLFAKCGATQYTQLECSAKDNFVDIICVKNRVYGITKTYNFHVWDCTTCIGSSLIPRLVLEFEPKFNTQHPYSYRGRLHLVESEEEILLVLIHTPLKRRLDNKGGIAAYNKLFPFCEVYKMHFNTKEWVRIYSLGDRVLFLVRSQSMSISSHEFPQYQRNSIYYWHRLPAIGEKASLGIFSMEDGSLKLIDAKLG